MLGGALESPLQPGSTVKAVSSLKRCARPLAWLRRWRLRGWWRACPCKRKWPDPDGESVKFRYPGRARLNSSNEDKDIMKLRKEQSKPKQQKPARPAHGLESAGWHQMNRKQRREMARKIQAEDLSLEVGIPMRPALISATNPTTWQCLLPETSNPCGASAAPPPS